VRIWIAASLSALALVALVGVARHRPQTFPTGDSALIESYTIRAVHGGLLLGPYSRYRWHHPGPLYFYVLAPFYALSGQRTAGLHIGALAINLTAVLAMVAITFHSTHYVTAVALAAASAVYLTRVPELLGSIWNPHVLVIPTMALIVIAAEAAAGRPRLLPLVALLASFAAQTHVGLVPTTLMISAAAFVAVAAPIFIATNRRPQPASHLSEASDDRHQGQRRWRPVFTTLLVLGIVWLPPIVEQLWHRPGNVTELVRYFATPGTPGRPFRTAFYAWADATAGVLGSDFDIARGHALPRSHAGWSQAVALSEMAGLIGIAGWARLTRRRFHFTLSVMLVAASVVALWSASRISGEMLDHDVFWMSGLGAINLAALFAAAVSVTGFRDTVKPRGAAAACGVLLALGLLRGFAEFQRSSVPTADAAAIRATSDAIQSYTQLERIERPLIVIDQPAWQLVVGVLLQLQKAGAPFAVERDWLTMFTDDVAPTGDERVAVSIGSAERHVHNGNRSGNVVIAEYPPVFADAVVIH
jgi:hypothetical protein